MIPAFDAVYEPPLPGVARRYVAVESAPFSLTGPLNVTKTWVTWCFLFRTSWTWATVTTGAITVSVPLTNVIV